MQATLPTHHVSTQNSEVRFYPVALGTQRGPICESISSAIGGAVGAIGVTACALLGEKILQAAGNNAYNLPPYANLLVPAIIGTTVIAGGAGFLRGMCTPNAETI